jgi:mono/diheme cytochrome c family protein
MDYASILFFRICLTFIIPKVIFVFYPLNLKIFSMKRILKILGLLLGVILLAAMAVAAYVKIVLPDVGPAPEIKVAKTQVQIQRGEYLANHVLVCMDCHSTRDWSEFSAPPVPGTLGKGGEIFDKSMGFPGTYYSANITPAGIGKWTDGEIFRAITTGVRKNGKPIFPVMPHKNYGQLDEEDIKSVIAYLRTLPSIEIKVPESISDFPMNFIINTIPSKANLQKMPAEGNSLAYGKYIITAASCAECHTPFEEGKFNEEFSLAGGRKFALPCGLITTANLTPDNETGIGLWTKEVFLRRFTAFRDSSMQHKKVAMTDFNTIMPWTMYAGMTDKDLGAIYDYLRSLPAKKHSIVKYQPGVKN